MKKLLLFMILPIFLLLAGCENNPVGSLLYNGVNNTDPNAWTNPFYLYKNGDLATLILPFDDAVQAYTDYWESGRKHELDLNFIENGTKIIYMNWDGSASKTYQFGTLQTDYVGWGLLANGDESPKDISKGAYTVLKFSAKGSLNIGVKFQIESDAADAANFIEIFSLSNNWQEYSMPLNPANLTNVASYVKFILKSIAPSPTPPLNGGTVYINNIRLEK